MVGLRREIDTSAAPTDRCPADRQVVSTVIDSAAHEHSNAWAEREVEWKVEAATNYLRHHLKLRIDWRHKPRLRVSRRCDMDDDARFDLLRRLFALITAESEDAAAAAADGQGRDVPDGRLYELAVTLHAAGEKIAVMADAVVAILQPAQTGGC